MRTETEPAEESRHASTPAEEMATERANTYYAEGPSADPAAPPPPAPPRQVGPNDTEVIEDVYEEPPR
jgi:hypothetical protein